MPAIIPESVLEKENRLRATLHAYKRIVIAYSGGVDSTYLAALAHEELGAGALLVIADSPSIPRTELSEARALASRHAWALEIIQTAEFKQEAFVKNERDRCYHCKHELFSNLINYAKTRGIYVVAYGETADDLADVTRMGKVAAEELGVVAPLLEAGMTKDDIRVLSEGMGLPTAAKASFACLASRVPVGTRLQITDLARIEQAEELLKSLNFRQYRARHHGEICRIEVDKDDLRRFADDTLREHIVKAIKALGYRYVTLDLSGYRTGSTAAIPEQS
jgi:uncharacterized protein